MSNQIDRDLRDLGRYANRIQTIMKRLSVGTDKQFSMILFNQRAMAAFHRQDNSSVVHKSTAAKASDAVREMRFKLYADTLFSDELGNSQ